MRKPKHREPTPIKKIEVPIRHFNLRVILLAIAIAIAAVAIGYGIYFALHKEPGWRNVEVTADQMNCSSEFILSYHFGTGKTDATAEYKQVASVYTQATIEGYRLFNTEAENSELSKIDDHPNEAVKIDPALYTALEQIVKSGNRTIYLAPVNVEYQRVFSAEASVVAELYDPNVNEEAKKYVTELTAFLNDPKMINLELKGDNTVKLFVHKDLLSYAQKNEIDDYLDFGWMRNAFVIDYLAQKLKDSGHTKGYIASYDGFTRNLYEGDQTYSLNLFNRLGNDVYITGIMDYQGPMAIVSLRNYPMGNADRWHYYCYDNGFITTAMIDPADGMSKSSTNNVVAYSKTASCAQLLLKLAPVFVTEELDDQPLQNLAKQKIYCIWFEDGNMVATDSKLSVRIPEETE